MKKIIEIFSPVLALTISLMIFFAWTSGCSSYTTYSYTLRKAGSIPYVAPEIKLINQFNFKFILGEKNSKYILINFIYLNCPHACPISVLKMRKIVYGCDNKLFSNLKFLSISFDPKRDTVKKIHIFWSLQGQLPQWNIAVIDKSEKKLEEKFSKIGVWAKYDRLNEFSHTNFFFLLDKSGKIIDVFFPEENIEKILKKLEEKINWRK